MRLNRLFSVAMLSFLFGFCRFPPGGHRKMGDGCVGALTGISPPPLRSTGHQPACGPCLALPAFSAARFLTTLLWQYRQDGDYKYCWRPCCFVS